MKIKFLYLLPVLLVFLTFSENAFSQNSKPESQSSDKNQQKVEFVDFCTMVKNPEKYHNKTFSTKATYVFTFDSTFIFNSNCSQKENIVNAYYDCSSDECVKDLNRKFPLPDDPDALFGEGQRAEVILTGKFFVNNEKNALSFYIKDVESAEDKP